MKMKMKKATKMKYNMVFTGDEVVKNFNLETNRRLELIFNSIDNGFAEAGLAKCNKCKVYKDEEHLDFECDGGPICAACLDLGYLHD